MKKRVQKRLLAILLSILVVAEVVVSVVLGTVAENAGSGNESAIDTTTRQLIDFSDCEEATGIEDTAWPKGISKIGNDEKFPYSSSFRVDIAKYETDKKFLKFNFDKANSAVNNNNLDGHGGTQDIYLKVSIPYWYINYLKDFTVDYIYNYNKTGSSSTQNKYKGYYIIGLSDGETFSKDVELRNGNNTAKQFETLEKNATVQSGSVNKIVRNLSKFTGASADTFLGATQRPKDASLWTTEDLASQTKLDIVIFFAPPNLTNADKNSGYYFGIKGVSVTLEGPALEIENIDNEDYVTPDIIDFENGTTIEQIKTNYSNIKFNSSNKSVLSDDAFESNNAFLFKRWKDTYYVKDESGEKIQDVDSQGAPKFDSNGNPVYKTATSETYNSDFEYTKSYDTDSFFSFKLQRDVTRSKGITFMAKNITDRALTFRIWIAPGNAVDDGENKYKSKGKYQYLFTLPANMPEYQRISIYWNNVGLMSFTNGGEWWAGSSSGSEITADELASGITLQFRNRSAIEMADPGVLFDDFDYITKKFVNERTATLVDFSGAEVGSKLPSNITVGGAYEGSTEIIKNSDGSNALRLNYDAPAKTDYNQNYFESPHIRCRPFSVIKIAVPKGSMDDLSEISIDMTNNRDSIGERNDQTRIYTDTLWNFGIADSVSGKYGKTSEINDVVNWLGNTTVTRKPVGMLSTDQGGMTRWVDKNGTKWTKEELKEIDTFVLYISAPDGDGTKGESFQLNSITLVYNEPPQYNENKVREIVHSDAAQPPSSGNITAESVPVGTQDPNSDEFRTAIDVNVKDTSNTEALVFRNELTEFHRNVLPFYNKDSAIFHMFAYSKKDVKFHVTISDKNNSELSTDVVIEAATTKLYKEVSVNFKEIYDLAAQDSEFEFDMSDIRQIKILPVVEEPTNIKIAGVTILTGTYLRSEDYPENRKFVNLVNFDNCDVGSKGDNLQLPSNVSVSGYAGTKEIVKTADGSHALQINFDKALINEGTELHQTNKRNNIVLDVKVPLRSLKGLSKVNFTITNNGYSLAEQTSSALKSYLTMAVIGDPVFVKQGESANGFGAQKGETVTTSLKVKDGYAGSSSYYITSWMPSSSCTELTEDAFDKFQSVRIYIAVPDITATEVDKGLNFQINSIDLEFEEEPKYDEDLTRMIVDGVSKDILTTDNNTITSTKVKIASNNINYRNIKQYYTIEAKKGNEAAIIVTNSLSKFLRNASPFVDTATFRMYYQSPIATEVQINLVNSYGERLSTKVKFAQSQSDKFDTLEFSLKKVYEEFLRTGGSFNLKDIFSIEIIPLGKDDIKFNIACPTLWSKEAGSAGSAGNYYYALEDDSVRIEAYNYNITDDFKVTVENLNVEQEIATNGTKLPEGATVIKMIKVSLRNGKGELIEPSGRFWVSFRLPNDTDLTMVKMYEMFYDGSLKEIKHVVMDANNYISCEDFFSSKTFAILSVPPVKEVVLDSTEDESGYYYEIIVEGEDVVDTPSQEIIRKIIRRRKKATNSDYTWLWIIIVIVAVVVVIVTGLVLFLIIRKKKKAATV